MVGDMFLSNKKPEPIVTELSKLNISLVFITQSYFAVPKNVRLSYTLCFVMKTPNKRELQQITVNQSSDIDFKDFMKMYKQCTNDSYLFIVNGTSLSSDIPLRFRGNLV